MQDKFIKNDKRNNDYNEIMYKFNAFMKFLLKKYFCLKTQKSFRNLPRGIPPILTDKQIST